MNDIPEQNQKERVENVLMSVRDSLSAVLSLSELSENERNDVLARTLDLIIQEALARVVSGMSEEEALQLTQRLEEKPTEGELVTYLLTSVPDFDVVLEQASVDYLLEVHARMYPKEEHADDSTPNTQ